MTHVLSETFVHRPQHNMLLHPVGATGVYFLYVGGEVMNFKSFLPTGVLGFE